MGQCASSSGGKERKTPREHRKEAKQVATKAPDAKPVEKADHGKPAHVNAQAVRAGRARVLDNATPDVTTLYTLGKVLGRGQFGVTRLATDKAIGEELACKSISKRKLLNKEDVEDVRREVQILHHLGGHPNITQLKGAFEDRHNVHLVMELCSGGELFDRIVARGFYSEKDAAYMCRSILKVVGHCHSLGVIHRDLKPENFLLSSKAEDAALKSCDFGLSVFFKPNEVFNDVVGSPYYVAPEVLRRKYGKEADIWSSGVILYILLCGVPPFYGETEQQIFDSILKGRLDLSSDPWPRISSDAKDCVRRMLTQDPRKRATANEILQHQWMKEHGTASSAPLDNVILRRMQGFSAMNKLKQQALYILAKNMAPAEVAGLRAIFQAMDTDGSGTITIDELRRGLREQGSNVSEEELDTLVRQLDADNSGAIDIEEFIAGTINLSAMQSSDNLAAVFEEFDTDGSGYLSRDELYAALKQYGGDVHVDIEQVLAEVDKDADGRIDFDEFTAMMTAGNQEILSSKSTLRRANLAEKVVSMRPSRHSTS